MDLERVMVRMVADASQYNRVMNAVEGRLLGMARRMTTVGWLMQAPIVATTGAVAALTIATGFASANAFKLAAAYESSRVSLEVMTQSASRGREVLDKIVQLGVETPFKSPELIEYGKELLAIGVTAGDVVDTLKVLSSVGSAVGVEKMPNIVLAYGQVKTAGRLMGQELRQFFNAGVPLIEFLAKVKNVPESSIKGMVERAEVSFTDVQKALNLMVGNGGRFEGLNERRMQTVEGRWSAFIETVQITLREIGSSFFKAFGIADWLNDMTERLKTGEGMFDAFFAKVRQGADTVVRVFRTVSYWVQKTVAFVREWAAANQDVLVLAGKILVVFLAIQVAMSAVTVAVLAAKAALVVLAVYLAEASGLLENFGDRFLAAFQNAAPFFKDLTGLLKEAFAAEDWQSVGELIGLGIKAGLKLVLAGLFDEFEMVMSGIGMAIEMRFAKIWKGIKNNLNSFLDAINPTVDQKQEEARAVGRENEFQQMVKDIEARHAAEIARIKARQNAANEMLIAPERAQLDAIRGRVQLSREAKAAEEYYRQFPWMKAAEEAVDEVSKAFRKPWDELKNQAEILFGVDPTKWSETGKDWFARNERQLRAEFEGVSLAVSAVAAAGEALGSIPDVKKAVTAIPTYLQMNTRAAQLAEHIKKEMSEGKWAGETLDKFELFNTRMDLLKQARQGPYVYNQVGQNSPFFRMARDLVMPGSLLNQKEYEFGMMEEFNNLKKAVGAATINLPRVALRGSQEATDAVNREQIEVRNVQEEIRNVLTQAKMIQEQQREYMRQVVEELRKMQEEKPEQWGGGGDF